MPNEVIAKKINRTNFFNKIREFFFNGKLSQSQVDGIEVILDEWESRTLTDLRYLAYILATVYHECAGTFQPIEEYGRGKGKKYGKKIKMNGTAYKVPNQLYYGRGFVQLTWYENYEKMGKILGENLVDFPERALDCKVATDILFEGMLRGLFTGKKLSQYFNEKSESTTNQYWYNARKIINGEDKASLIASYGKLFYTALI